MKTHIIQNGRVINTILATVEEVQQAFPDTFCIDAAIGGTIGDLWDGAAFTSPPVDVVEKRKAMLMYVNAECDRRMSALVTGYPEREQQTFPKQEQEARAFIADPNAATPLIDELAVNRGVVKADLSARIIAKADAFAPYAGKIIGYRQKLEDQINAAADVDALNAIDIVSGWTA